MPGSKDDIENALTQAFREMYHVSMVAIPHNPPYYEAFDNDDVLKSALSTLADTLREEKATTA